MARTTRFLITGNEPLMFSVECSSQSARPHIPIARTCVVLAAFWFGMGEPHAAATTFESQTLEELAASSDVVAVGRVIAVEAMPEGPNARTGIHTRITIATEEVFAGDPVSVVECWVQGGQLGSFRRVVRGQARFQVSERVAVFLFRSTDGSLWPTGMVQGKWQVRGEGADALFIPPDSHPPGEPSPVAADVAPESLSRRAFERRVRVSRGER